MFHLLDLQNVAVRRGAGDVLRDVNLTVRAGELAVLLGPNGAGKTTLLDTISGLAHARAGHIRFRGNEIGAWSRTRRARLGIRHVEQGRAVFSELTVAENLSVAAPRRNHHKVFDLFPELTQRIDTPAGLLSGGEQQMLVIGRALLGLRRDDHAQFGPTLLLLDELSLGLAPIVAARILPVVRGLTERGTAVLLVEQFAHLVLPIADAVHLLDRGRISFSGTAGDLQANPHLLHETYLATSSNPAGPEGRTLASRGSGSS